MASSLTRSATAPCSFGQERLWFINEFNGATGAYNETAGARVRGPLDVAALRSGLAEIVRRHAALRTHFDLEDGVPVQIIEPTLEVELERIAVSGGEEELQRVGTRLASTAFDLRRGPLLRAHLLELGAEDHVLLLVFHHTICDGQSRVIVMHELAQLYRQYGNGASAQLPELDVHYADYARRQREQLRGDVLERALAWWRERLAGIPEALELPTDHPRPAALSYRGATRRSALAPELSAQLSEFTRAEGVSAFATVLAALALVLHRYSGQDMIVVGTATGGRERRELTAAVGMFVNTVVLPIDVGGDPSFRDLCLRVRRAVMEGLVHQDAPFEKLVAERQQAPDLSRHPLFQVLAAVRPHAALDIPGAQPFAPGLEHSRVELTLWLEETPSGPELIWEYSTDLFDHATLERLERHCLALLRGGLEAPEAPIAQLTMLGPTERSELLAQSEPASPDFPVACMHTLFEAQVRRAPEAVAVRFEGHSLTYAQLNARANRLAHHLRALGVGPETLVALLLHRSPDLVVAILAVLKAGGAYVPIDPEYPEARVAFVMSDAQPAVVLTESTLRERVPDGGVPVIELDASASAVAQASAENPAPLAQPENLAYVIYTSGSTGQPKGVQVEHRQVARLFTATAHWYGFGDRDAWILAHSYAFDVSVWELWGALAHGGRIVVAPFWVTRSPDAFAELVAGEAVTVLCATPSLFGSVQEDLLARAEQLRIRYVVFAGEALAPVTLRPWFERFGDQGAALVNMYGITETTVHSTYRVIEAADCERDASPVGVPIPDLSLYLLDPAGEPVPVGVAGEIYVGGAGVTRGYLRRPELTAQRFLDNPFGPGRLYRSGDLARRMANGETAFLGRMDDQVKVRGFRIELGEIRSVIEEHAGVAESAVVARRGDDGEIALVAYVVPDAERAGVVRALTRIQADQGVGSEHVFEMADGTAVFGVNRSETEYLYEETCVRDDYFRNGIELGPGACVLDVGANIGLFALRAAQRAPGVRVIACEPMPEVHATLERNGELHGVRLEALRCALGASAGTASFSYFPHATLLSGRYADDEADAAMVRQMLANSGELTDTRIDVEDLLADRLATETVECELRTLSEVIAERDLARVDLLKIDAEKAELDVLAGLGDEDWPKIGQVVIEVHGDQSRLRVVTELLRSRGFTSVVEQDELLSGAELYNVFARRSEAAEVRSGAGDASPEARPECWRGPNALRESLRAALGATLPAYMVPGSITFVSELPLTTNGKLDQRRLPAPEFAHAAPTESTAPATDTEQRMAGLWQELLGVQRVGREDNFFHLGGHSLVAARVAARVRDTEGIAMSVRTLFEHPTLESFAHAVDAATAASSPAGTPAPLASGAAEHPVSRQQQQILFFSHLASEHPTYNSALAFRVRGRFDAQALARALATVYRRHEVLRSVLVWDEHSARQLVGDLPAPLTEVDLSTAADREAQLADRLVADARAPFDLHRDSPLRTFVYRLADDEHAVLFVPHHVAFDARAVEVLFAELAALYADPSATLPPLALQYGDFARWQRELLAGDRLAAEQSFWRAALAGAPTRLQLATDHPRPPMVTFAGASEVHRLPGTLADAVRTCSRSANATPYMVLLAAFAALLYRRSGQDDILFGGPMANRSVPEFEDLIGFVANTVVVRARLAGNPTFAELLGRVRGSVLASYEHQHSPLELVLDAVRPERDPAYNPLVQVNFRVRVGSEPALELAGAQTEPIPVDLGLARFDLACEMHVLEHAIEAQFNWNTALYERDTIARLAADYQRLLTHALADPEVRLLDLDLGAPASVDSASETRSGSEGRSIRGFRARGRGA